MCLASNKFRDKIFRKLFKKIPYIFEIINNMFLSSVLYSYLFFYIFWKQKCYLVKCTCVLWKIFISWCNAMKITYAKFKFVTCDNAHALHEYVSCKKNCPSICYAILITLRCFMNYFYMPKYKKIETLTHTVNWWSQYAFAFVLITKVLIMAFYKS